MTEALINKKRYIERFGAEAQYKPESDINNEDEKEEKGFVGENYEETNKDMKDNS